MGKGFDDFSEKDQKIKFGEMGRQKWDENVIYMGLCWQRNGVPNDDEPTARERQYSVRGEE